MLTRCKWPVFVLGLLFAGHSFALAQDRHQPGHGPKSTHSQPYAGQQARVISSLSEQEIADLREGRGMGFARPAELNGYPGPLHVLELAGELKLTSAQQQAVKAIFERMKERARAAGAQYIESERAVTESFRSGADSEAIRNLVRQADGARAEVRLAHLEAHIETAPLLTPEQRQLYIELRGYAGQSGSGHEHQHRH